jgi:hypothetical protein
VTLLKDSTRMPAGEEAILVRIMPLADDEETTPEDVFVLDYRGQPIVALRRHVKALD